MKGTTVFSGRSQAKMAVLLAAAVRQLENANKVKKQPKKGRK